VYVVELDSKVASIRRFREANPAYRDGRMCFYVGMTGLTPEERFRNHKRGYKGNRFVREFGIRLLPELYEKLNPMAYAEAAKKEEDLARALRKRGFGVWQH
jgi:hypothetical protein